MSNRVDVLIIGAGPVGLMCAHLGQLCGLSIAIVDKSPGPLQAGRADAFNARTLQLLELVNLFDELYPLGKTCNTSSIWSNGHFISRQSTWWEELEGCLHKHFLMLGQCYVEQLLDKTLKDSGNAVKRSAEVVNVEPLGDGYLARLSNGDHIQTGYIIGADGPRSMVREQFGISFSITKAELLWAVIDGVVETDFPKVPEIISFQTDTSDVAWIPREGELDRFYVRMDVSDFTTDDIIAKINRAINPYKLKFKEIKWFSKFSVKESVAEKFSVDNRIFLVGDACHIHSINGGQGLNTGLADAFNLMWKLNLVINFQVSPSLLETYEKERKPIAQSVIEASGQLVRATKYSKKGTHAEDYLKILKQHAGNITGMGIRYGDRGLPGSRIFDFNLYRGDIETRLYSVLHYTHFTLLVFSDSALNLNVPALVKIIQIYPNAQQVAYWTNKSPYSNVAILVRPDSYIESSASLENIESLIHAF